VSPLLAFTRSVCRGAEFYIIIAYNLFTAGDPLGGSFAELTLNVVLRHFPADFRPGTHFFMNSIKFYTRIVYSGAA